jgi:RNA recognition motif-containing protein
LALKDHPPVNIFVGNLSYSTTHDELYDVFAEFGQVERVSIMTDRETGQSRGFAFVEMYDREEAEKAIEHLNGYELNGRALNVNESRPKPQGGGGGFKGGGGGGGFKNRGGKGGGGGGGGNKGGGGKKRYTRH